MEVTKCYSTISQEGLCNAPDRGEWSTCAVELRAIHLAHSKAVVGWAGTTPAAAAPSEDSSTLQHHSQVTWIHPSFLPCFYYGLLLSDYHTHSWSMSSDGWLQIKGCRVPWEESRAFSSCKKDFCRGESAEIPSCLNFQAKGRNGNQR